jgi:hypothetical protein
VLRLEHGVCNTSVAYLRERRGPPPNASTPPLPRGVGTGVETQCVDTSRTRHALGWPRVGTFHPTPMYGQRRGAPVTVGAYDGVAEEARLARRRTAVAPDGWSRMLLLRALHAAHEAGEMVVQARRLW